MRGQLLLRKLARKDVDKQKLAVVVAKQPALLSEIFAGLSSDEASVKYGSVKILRIISESDPAVLYPKINFVFDLLDSGNQIIKWGGIIIIANLAGVDAKRKIDKILKRYLEPISGSELITASNVIGGAARIALAKPHLTDRVVDEIFKVEKARYQTPECRDIALGHVIEAFGMLFKQSKRQERILKLVKKQLKNPRHATRKKAEKFVKKLVDGSRAKKTKSGR
jgi:hypothetical protein